MKVKCPSCKKVCHETTDTYDPDVRPNGSMVELLDPWKSWGWGKFGDYRNGGSEVMASDMECPCCECPLAPSGRLLVVPDDYRPIPKIKTLAELNQERIDAEFTEQAGELSDEPISSSPFEIDAKPWMCVICEWTGKTEAALKRHCTMMGHG